MRTNAATAVRLLGPSDARDAALAGEVAALINAAYTTTEVGIWATGHTRAQWTPCARPA